MPDAPPTLRVTSSAFAPGQPIPRDHTCDGADRSPPLAWVGAPANTQAFALIMDDPDAPGKTWLHWTAWDLPARVTSLAMGQDVKAQGGREGVTDSGPAGYAGPCPPGGTHRYFFRVYALRKPLGLPAGANLSALQAALEGNVLAWGETMGTYSRRAR